MAEIKAVIFDLWDTIITLNQKQSLCQLVNKLLIPKMPHDEFRFRFVGAIMQKRFSTKEDAFIAVFNEFGIEPKKESLEKVINAWAEYRKKTDWFPDSEGVLKKLKQKYKLALISNADCFTDEIIEKLNVMNYFDSAVLSYDVHLLKPNPKIFQLILDKSSLKSEEAVMVGDSVEADITGAKAVGIKTAWLDRSREGKKPETADYIINSLEEIIPILKAVEGK